MRSLYLIICVGLISCTSNSIVQQQLSIESEDLINCWTHSTEEDSDDLQIFRPCASMEFPASRYRLSMTLRPNGTAEYLMLAPDDAHFNVEGSWIYSDENNNFQLLNEKEDAILAGILEEIEEDVLAIRIR